MRLLPVATTVALVLVASLAIVSRQDGAIAGTALRMDVRALARHSDLVIEARVLSAQAFETAEGLVETEYLIQVDRTFVGDDQPYRSIRMPGGVLPDGSGMVLAGMPHIEPGEDVLVFLGPESGSGVRMPVGLAQGKLRVVRHTDGTKSLVGDLAGVTLVGERGAIAQGEGGRVRGYAEVVAEIEAALAAKRTR